MMKWIEGLFGRALPRASTLRILSSKHGDREISFTVGDAAWREAEALVKRAQAEEGATLLLIPGGDLSKPADRIQSLAELAPGDEARLLPRIVGG